ncbi:MAG: S8 family serine peptidase [Alphaproteobacteria bacterium]|nr:S8 family serine peptidase [Alphaproteobacteria bacterium]
MFKKSLHCATAAIAISAAMIGVADAKKNKRAPARAPAETTQPAPTPPAPPPPPAATAPLATLSHTAAATVGANGVDAAYGSLDAFYGSLDAFWGSLDPFFGSLDPFYGSLDPFYGSLDPFWGSLDPFWGSLDPFYGSLDAFYGSLDAFQGSLGAYWGSLDPFYGSLDPFYGSLDPFWGSLDPFFGSLDPFYGSLDPFYGSLDPFYSDAGFGLLLRNAKDTFGDIVETKTGKSFEEAFWLPFAQKHELAKYAGENAVAIDQATLGMILLDFNDQLNHFVDIDRVDHWMVTANWSPRVSQEAGLGVDVKVGILDTLVNDADLIGGQFTGQTGYQVAEQTHGASVTGLVAGAHDGRGVMGVAPNVEVFSANPFDETMTASWEDVRTGIVNLASSGVNVINMSLGVADYTLHQDWATEVFSSDEAVRDAANVVFVKAAGNSGVTQTSNIAWDQAKNAADQYGSDALNERLLIVGSLSTNGEISAFSNRPGSACLTVAGQCFNGYRLRDRFLVAPGELLLVSDGAGGVTRATGTSFAAPLVTGTVALIQNRWQWFKYFPKETTDVVLLSATDLGAPGVDDVYGHGLLNIGATMEPLNLSSLVIGGGFGSNFVLNGSGLSAAAQLLFQSNETITALEFIGRTYRDFEISLADLGLTTEDVTQTADSQNDQDLSSLLNATLSWGGASNGGGGLFGGYFNGFTDNARLSDVRIGSANSAWTARFSATAREAGEFVPADAVPFQMGAEFRNNESGLRVMLGEGDASLAFAQGGTFTLRSDHDIDTGGVNPFLGLASGGLYAATNLPVSERLTLGFGFAQDEDRNVFADPVTGEVRNSFDGVDDYRANAMTMNVGYAVGPGVDLTATYTYLDEATGFLGVQGAGALSLAGGAKTDAMTLGANVRMANGVDVSLSGSVGRTRGGQFENSILGVEDGVRSTAFQIAASKAGIFGESDAIRLSFAQPLQVEAGSIEVTSMQVVDRTTGELGLVTDRIGLDGAARRYVSEIMYGVPVFDGAASMNAFTRYELNNRDYGFAQDVFSTGVRLNVGF